MVLIIWITVYELVACGDGSAIKITATTEPTALARDEAAPLHQGMDVYGHFSAKGKGHSLLYVSRYVVASLTVTGYSLFSLLHCAFVSLPRMT